MEHQLTIESSTKALALVEPFLAKIAKDVMDEKQYGNAVVVLTEAVNNAIIHGNGSDISKNVEIFISLQEHDVVMRICDKGSGFDLDAIPDPTAPENLLSDGGRGVFLMQAMSRKAEFLIHEDGSETILHVPFTPLPEN
jgi:serine/threonine-protein kinase RsbW